MCYLNELLILSPLKYASSLWQPLCGGRCAVQWDAGMNKRQAAGHTWGMRKISHLGKPGVKSGGAKKKKNLSHMAVVGKWGWFHFLLSWQMSGTACKGLEGKCACKMQKFMKKHKLIISSVQFFYDIILSSLTPCYFPLISQSLLWIKCTNPIHPPPLCQAL